MIVQKISCFLIIFGLAIFSSSCSDRDTIPMQVELTRSVSKLPFVIALDQGLYEKYGLDIEVRMEEPEFDGGIHMPSDNFVARNWRRLRLAAGQEAAWNPDIRISGANNRIYLMTASAREPQRVALAATDCTARQKIVARKGLDRLEALKGKRIGVSSIGSNSGFAALLLAERMGWDPVQDLSIQSGGNELEVLRDGRVDAYIASERSAAVAVQEGYPILADLSAWQEPLPGNSIMVRPEWLEIPDNREAARRFLKATVEGIAIFHQNRELVLNILSKWHGITDKTVAEAVYESGARIPRKPYPCYEGIIRAMQRYDSNAMRQYSPADFYDDSLLRELDESRFIDGLYITHESKSP